MEVRMAVLVAKIMAEPKPWMMRKAISTGAEGARAQSTEARV